LLCITGIFCLAQKPLTNSRQSSYFTYIYGLKAEDVLRFYKHPGEKADENILHNPIDSFKTDSENYWINKLPAGNYLKVYAEKNQLQYKLIENHTAFLRLIENGNDLRFIFLDRKRNLISNAVVYVNNKLTPYDAANGLYKTNYNKKDTVITASYEGVTNYFSIKQRPKYGYYYHRHWYKTAWNFVKNKLRKHDNYNRYGPQTDLHYTSFIIFNKPKYKPLDTVKFKAFIVKKGSGKPIKAQQLLVRLKEEYRDKGTVIARINNYREGGYEYQFVLTDSLKLTLDQEYIVNLEDISGLKYDNNKAESDDEDEFVAKRKVYASGKFTYEDYELKSIKFEMRADKEDNGPGNPLSVYLKATDENNLTVPDGRVNLSVTTRHLVKYTRNNVFIPDTLWVHQLQLDPVGETKVTLPDSIFPPASIDYRINADFLNSANESQSAETNQTWSINKFDIEAKINGDTLIATYKVNGKDTQAPAVISAITNEDDVLSKIKVNLPYKLIINPNIASYTIETDSDNTDVEVNKNGGGLLIKGYRTADSLFVRVINPNRLHFWYSVFSGNRQMDAGQADSLFYKKAYGKPGNVTFVVDYIWAGESKSESALVAYADKVLTVNVKQPISVYPGQRVQTDIVVTDIKGKPVANTDVTAWSLTSNFTGYDAPHVPYLGKLYRYRKTKAAFHVDEFPEAGSLKLNWTRWGREIGLDSIAYYQFTHPKTIYRIEEPAGDTLTQVAPFIVKDGEIIPVHILYIDDRPVYFSRAQQLERYSFQVYPGKHSFRFRTTHQNIRLDSVMVEKSKKLIFGLNANDTLNHAVLIQKAPDTLTTYEAELINKYMITVENNFGWKMAGLQQGNLNILLNPNVNTYNQGKILAGPLVDNYAIFTLRDEKPRLFFTEPGYSYLFEPGLLRQKSIATKYPFNKSLWDDKGTDDYKQYVLTQNETDTIWQRYLDLRRYSEVLFVNKPVTARRSGSLDIKLTIGKKEKLPFIKNIIIYRYRDPDYIRIYPGNTSDFGNLEAGKYRLLFLLRGDSYDIIDSIFIKPYGINSYNLNIRPAHQRDSVSIKINNIIDNRSGSYTKTDSNIENDALKLKEAFNDKYFDDSAFGNTMAGRIIGSDDKLPIVGCSLRVKGTNRGALTDINGEFRIKVPASGTIVVSYIGYETREVPIEQAEWLPSALILTTMPLMKWWRSDIPAKDAAT
jgi:hypothetical protein